MDIISKLLPGKSKPESKTQSEHLQSWEFIIDSEGNYLNISPEVTECLGIQPSEFQDQSIFMYAIDDSSGDKLHTLFTQQNFPIDTDLTLLTKSGEPLLCNLKLTQFNEEYQSLPTYIGIIQTLESRQESNKSYLFQKTQNLIENVDTKTSSIDVDKNEFKKIEKREYQVAEIENIQKTIDIVYSSDILEDLEHYANEVNHLIEPIDIYKITYKVINKFIPNSNLVMSISQRESDDPLFPIVKLENEISYFPKTTNFAGILNYITQTNKIIYQPDQIPPSIKKSVETKDIKIPASILGAPLTLGNRTLGALLLFENKEVSKYTDRHLEYLTAIGSKMAVALENAFLFQEMQYAISAIEVREKYQNQVSQAVKILANFGTKNLDEVLGLLGKAANVDRIFYARSNVDEESESWSVHSNWASEEKFDPLYLNNDILFDIFQDFLSSLSEKGYFQVNYERLDRPLDNWLYSRGTKSILGLSVLNEKPIPDIIVFEDMQQKHYWNVDEIRFLGLVSDTLSSIQINEDKSNLLKNQILEIETLNFIKEKLYTADSLNEMLKIIMKYIFPVDIHESVLYVFGDFGFKQPDHFEIAAKWSKDEEFNQSIQIHTFDRNTVNSLFHQEFPTYFPKLRNANLSSKTQQLFSKLNISSLGIIPLKSNDHRFGSIILCSNQPHEFSQEEQRLVDDLLETITASIEKFLIIEQSPKSTTQNEFFRKINYLIRSNNLTEILAFLTEYVHKDESSNSSLFLLEKRENPNSTNYFEINKEYSKNEISQIYNVWKSSEFNMLLNKLIDQNIDGFFDLTSINDKDFLVEELKKLKILSGRLIPFQNYGSIVGYLIVLTDQAGGIQHEKVLNLKYAVNEISILLDTLSTTRNFTQLDNKINIAASIVRDTSSILNLDELINEITRQVQEKFGFLSVSLHICTNDTNILDKVAIAFPGYDKSNQESLVPKENSYLVVNDVFEKGQPVILNDIQDSKNEFVENEMPFTKSQLVLPLKIGDFMIGVLDIHSNRPDEFESKDLRYYQLLADQIAIEIQNARLYEKSQNMITDISDIDRIKSQFLANMSHEFRTPLNSIIGFSKVILTGIDGPINETQKQDLTAIHNAGQYLLRLVNDILDITKIEAGTMKLNMTKTNIPDLIKSLIPAAENLIKDKVIKLEIIEAYDIPEIIIDRNRISQVIMNILSNAVKFTDYGKITITTSLEKEHGKNKEVIITINDTGIGIDKLDQEKLFKPFEQANATGKERSIGSGLGLAISKSLIQLHNGRIGLLKSKPGEGSTFYIALPIKYKNS